MSKKTISHLLLLLAALIWGGGFIAQKAGTTLSPFAYNGMRNIIGSVVLVPVILAFGRKKSRGTSEIPDPEKKKAERKGLLVGGLCCGLTLCLASTLQQFGLYFHTDAGKTGFITALYIVIVPILGLFFHKKVRPLLWFCVLLGAGGFYLLTLAGKSGGFVLETGDFFVLLCAFAFSVQILCVSHFSRRCDGVKLACLQFLVTGVIDCSLMFLTGAPSWPDVLDCWFPIVYAGVISSGIAYTLQILGQKHAEPATASLIMSLEAVFSVIFSALLLGERMTGWELAGCTVIFAAVLLSQLPEKESNGSGNTLS